MAQLGVWSSDVVNMDRGGANSLELRLEATRRESVNDRHYVYFWADGIHVQARLEDDAQCLLVIIGAMPEGKKELVGLIDGVRESAQSWRELLLGLKRRGLAVAPGLTELSLSSTISFGGCDHESGRSRCPKG